MSKLLLLEIPPYETDICLRAWFYDRSCNGFFSFSIINPKSVYPKNTGRASSFEQSPLPTT